METVGIRCGIVVGQNLKLIVPNQILLTDKIKNTKMLDEYSIPDDARIYVAGGLRGN